MPGIEWIYTLLIDPLLGFHIADEIIFIATQPCVDFFECDGIYGGLLGSPPVLRQQQDLCASGI